jgi:hypothetical protein
MESPSLLPRRNKVLALLNLGDLASAERECEMLIADSRGEVGGDFIFLGVARWLNGQVEGTVEAWRAESKAKFTDAAQGLLAPLLLWFAGVRENRKKWIREVRNKVVRIGASPAANSWPGALARTYLYGCQFQDLSPQMSPQPIVRAREECQALFFVGVAQLQHGDTASALRSFESAVERAPSAFLRPEYYLAKYEVSRGFAGWSYDPK